MATRPCNLVNVGSHLYLMHFVVPILDSARLYQYEKKYYIPFPIVINFEFEKPVKWKQPVKPVLFTSKKRACFRTKL